jgi:hypothetical protein
MTDQSKLQGVKCVICGASSTRADWQVKTFPVCDSHTQAEIDEVLPQCISKLGLGQDVLFLIKRAMTEGRAALNWIEELLLRFYPCRGEVESAVMTFVDASGNRTIMDITVNLTDAPLQASQVEYSGPNGTGQIVPSVGPTTYTSSDPTTVTVDPNTGNLTYVKVGVATITGVNAGNKITSSGTVTVVSPVVAQSGVLNFIAQGGTLTAAQMNTLLSAGTQPALTPAQLAALFPAGGPTAVTVAVATAALIAASLPLTTAQISALNA